MNVVLLADKKIRKPFEAAVKKTVENKVADINIIGVETVLRGNTMSRIADFHNPHLLVIYKNVPTKDSMTINDCISLLRLRKPNLRIVYVYGKADNIDDFAAETKQFIENGITDIVADTAADAVINVINNPMTEEDVYALIDKLTALKEALVQKETETEAAEIKENQYEPLEDMDFPTVTAPDNFDMDKIVYEVSETKDIKHLTIGIAQLQHHNGCTHTAFEFASALSKKQKTAVIMADSDTYEALAVFHKLSMAAAKKGLKVHGIPVFPYEMHKEILNDYNVIIYDFSYLREEKRQAYDECNIKLMLSSSAQWDIATITDFINRNDEKYIRGIKFLFPRVAQSKFLKYNKLLSKSGISAYRITDSPDWLNPVADNIAVYTHIIENYSIDKSAVQPKRKLLKLK